MIDPTITIGNIIEISTILVGGTIVFTNVRGSVKHLKAEVVEMKLDIRALNKIVIEMAVADRRLSDAEQDIRDLRHGRGFIRDAIEGEWPKL